MRIIKDIGVNSAVQVMTGEDDARDTAHFLPYSQGNSQEAGNAQWLLPGRFYLPARFVVRRLDGLVDALITCVAPMDGTRSRGLVEYLEHIAPRFETLPMHPKTMPSGTK